MCKHDIPATEREDFSTGAVLDRLYPDVEDHGAFCPMCDGEGDYLGSLGRLDQYRCRACGMIFNESAW